MTTQESESEMGMQRFKVGYGLAVNVEPSIITGGVTASFVEQMKKLGAPEKQINAFLARDGQRDNGS